MAEIKKETDLIPEEFWDELLPICNKYLGTRGEEVLNEALSVLGKDRNNAVFGDLTDIFNALINKLVYLDRRADFRAELYALRRKYMVPPEAVKATPSKLELFISRFLTRRNAIALSIILVLLAGAGIYYVFKPDENSKISGKYDIVLWSQIYSRDMEETINEIIDNFNEKYKPYKSRFDLLPGSGDPMAEMGTQMKIMAVFAAGDPPDIIYGAPNPIFINGPYLLKVERDYLQSLNYFPKILNQVAIDDKYYYCYPVSISPKMILIANKTLIEGLGYNLGEIQERGISWDEFIDLADRLKLVTPYPVLVNLRGGTLFDVFWMSMVNNGGGMAVSDGRFLWTDKKMEETIQFFDKLVKRDIINPNILGGRLSNNIEIFNDGKAGIIIGSYLDYMMINNAGKVKAVILPFPNNKGNNLASLWDINGYFCFRQRDNYNTDKAQMTLMLAKTLTENSDWVSGTGALPASGLIWDRLNLYSEANHRFLYKYIDTSVPIDTSPLFNQIAFEAINPQLENIVTGKADVNQAMENIRNSLNRILSQNSK
ncbi:MAG TPA: ABC transporter substrate-binding protein [bacterium]|jgi:ABC-type glycerol-3-phosphate transport system substrate-binding protein|nr:carbohydrate ABC transporter substrate-binding protein [Dictyoglomota bacterium]HHV81790.1 carbohydrate ABC transporter substrate-binding protein [bacterium]HOL54390.1 ABC transporter substrate-binding protein [bacterium]HON72210.1 ABC transporter substrate-binding protein [bacterium]HPO81538.1 ABC transporter substrate-binding protein [bacterium]